MQKPAKVIMKILSVQGKCETKHHPGQEFDLSGDITLSAAGNPGTVCPALYYAIYPNLRLLKFGGSLPWEKDENLAHVACPDPLNPVVAQLRRVKE
ncbi:MAG: TIGR04076 family protein [Deltaproteobacteria bacterium]|nr:TIGR04076 family protein [Deltaproteobacteria bacterium]